MCEPTNQERADRVAKYVMDYHTTYDCGAPISTTVQDFISDLLHFNRIFGDLAGRQIVVAGDLLQSARDRFLEEVDMEEEE